MDYSGTLIWIKTKKVNNIWEIEEQTTATVYRSKVIATILEDSIELKYNYAGYGYNAFLKRVTPNSYEGIIRLGDVENGKASLHVYSHHNKILARADWYEEGIALDSFLEIEPISVDS